MAVDPRLQALQAAGLMDEPEKPINVKYYFFVFIKNLYVILTFFIISVTIAAIFVSKIPDRYETTAQIMIEKPEITRTADTNFENPQAQGYEMDYYNTQLEIMKSSAVLGQVVNELKLTDYYGNNNEEAAIANVRNLLRISKVGQSRLFNIGVRGTDPQLLTGIANAVARAYVRKNFEDVLYYSKEIMGWLPDDKNKGPIAVEDPFGNVKQVTKEELVESLPSIQTDPAIRSFREKKSFLESDLDALLKQYREKHPLVIKARANLKFIDESIANEKKRIVDNLKSQAEGRHTAGHARIIEEAQVPKSPMPTNRLPLVGVVGIAEILISFLIIILIDYFDDSIRSLEDLERKGVLLPFLGPIPYIKGGVTGSKNESQKMFAGYYQKDSQIAEAFRYLRVAINFSATPESLRTLVFTSCLPHEGKSFISHNMAISFAVDGNRTLIVDGDLRRPTMHRIFRIDNSTGLSNYLTSSIPLDAVIKETSVENLSIVTSGPVSPNPGEILGGERMRQFMKEIRERYDRVIIDCPPLTGIGDGYVVGSQIGQVIMVVASGRTPVDLIKHTHKQLEKAGTKILGVILSMVDMEKERFGGYNKHYYHTYTRYYNPTQPRS